MSRKRKIILGILVVIVVVLGGGVAALALRGTPPPETVRAARTTLVDDIDFTGRLQAKQQATLGFESSGTVRTVAVAVGDTVSAGQLLARQDAGTAALELAKARADRLSAAASAQSELDQAQAAALVSQAASARTVESARQTVRNAKQEYDQAKVVWDKTARESGDSSVTEAKYATVLSTLSAYRSAQAALKLAEKEAAKANEAASAAVTLSSVARQNIEQTAATTPGLSALAAAEQLASVRLAQRVLYAPFAGVVTDIAITAGEIATGGQEALTVQTVNDIEVVSAVPEADGALLTAGLPATVTFDALPDQEWAARVRSIDPAAVLIEGVPTYKVTVDVDRYEERLKPGLSATITVRVSEKPNVIAVPRRAVLTVEGTKQVRVLKDDGTIERRTVTTGSQGSDGSIEITAGIQEGDAIVVRQP